MNRKTNKKKKHKKQGYSCMEPRSYRFEKPWETIGRYKRNMIHAYQRVCYGYCDRDVWSIDWWFLRVMPDMLQSLRKTTHGYPSELVENSSEGQPMAMTEDKTERGVEAWDRILAQMRYLLMEANEETCRRKNPYEKEYRRCDKEFAEKYGLFGEKLRTPEEKAEEKKHRSERIHFMSELPEYKEISDKYMEEERKITQYRDRCKNEGLDMFKKWFWSLWD